MARTPSKYELAWRGRAKHPDVPAPVETPSAEVAAAADVQPDAAAETQLEVELDAAPSPLPAPDVIVLEFSSSNIAGASLDLATGRLTVTFRSGPPYCYANVTREQMDAWKAAPSAGSWFHHNIRQRTAAHPVVSPAAPSS